MAEQRRAEMIDSLELQTVAESARVGADDPRLG